MSSQGWELLVSCLSEITHDQSHPSAWLRWNSLWQNVVKNFNELDNGRTEIRFQVSWLPYASWPRYLMFAYQFDRQRVTIKIRKPPKIPMKLLYNSPYCKGLSFVSFTVIFKILALSSQWQAMNDTFAWVLSFWPLVVNFQLVGKRRKYELKVSKGDWKVFTSPNLFKNPEERMNV